MDCHVIFIDIYEATLAYMYNIILTIEQGFMMIPSINLYAHYIRH